VSATCSPNRARELYELVASFRKMASDSAVLWWKQGKLLLRLHDELLYKERYETWNEFVEKDLEISNHYSRSLIRVAKAFTEERAVRLGVTRCVMLLHVEPDARPALEQVILSENMTTAELRAKTQEINKRRKTFLRELVTSPPLAMPRIKLQRFIRAEFSVETVAELKKLADTRGKSVEALVSGIVTDYLAKSY
jgi:hypothetical protein